MEKFWEEASTLPVNSICHDDKYKFLLGEEYWNLRELFVSITFNDIVWEGLNGLILQNPFDKNQVFKIAKPNTDNLTEEFIKQEIFFGKLLEYKKNIIDLKPDVQKIISKLIIPKIRRLHEKPCVLMVEKINWLSLRHIETLRYYDNKLSDSQKKHINWLTDYEFKLYLEEEGFFVPPSNPQETEELYKNEDENIEQIEILEEIWDMCMERYRKEILPLMKKFKQDWYLHNDVHWWNFMQEIEKYIEWWNFLHWLDWKIYIIDFWKSIISK